MGVQVFRVQSADIKGSLIPLLGRGVSLICLVSFKEDSGSMRAFMLLFPREPQYPLIKEFTYIPEIIGALKL